MDLNARLLMPIDEVRVERVSYSDYRIDKRWGYFNILAKVAGKWYFRKKEYASAEEAENAAAVMTRKGINPRFWLEA
jgi:hypothetical protein